ncbi:hypothetical protein K1719_044760 [Acacia pycnantha]|nr:hypothetical protein K1719_044760 [Acacia pycnantha]
MGTIRRCSREGGSKYRTKEDYDEYEGAAKWKRQNEAKEAKKRKRAERKNVTQRIEVNEKTCYVEFDDRALHRMQIPLDAIDRPRKSGSEGVKGVKCKAERPPTPSAKSGPSHVGEDGAAELGELFGQVLDEKLGVMKAELQSFIEDHVKGLAI